MLKHTYLTRAFSLSLMVLTMLLSACDNEKDEAGANVVLNSFGPSVLRGTELKFIGANLNKVTAIILPDNIEIQASSFKTQTPELIVIDVPDEAVEGFVTLKTPNGDIVTKTALSILEPITLTKMPDEPIRPGDVFTLEGTYLNLIQEVIFATNKSVTEFEEQTRTSLTIRVPEDAESGRLILKDSEEIPNEMITELELQVVLPGITAIMPATVKAGNTITIEGTDLDLVTAIEFAGNQHVDAADFESISATQIVVTVPADTDDGEIRLVAPSLIKVESSSVLTMVVPGITDITPDPAKTGSEIVVTGTDLDLVSEVVFEGGVAGAIQDGGTATSITVSVPENAKSGAIEFRTRANKSVSSEAINMVKPAFATMTADVKLNEEITITGTNLDIVKEVRFSGGTIGVIESATETELVVTVPLGTLTGIVTLVAYNNDEVQSATELTILADVPEFDAFPDVARPGDLLVLTGAKLNLTKDVVFPGNVTATQFGDRTSTVLEVYVPANVALGKGKITFTTYGTDITESGDVRFWMAQPVADPALVFFDFDGKNSWWGGVVIETDDANTLNGSKYGKVDQGTLSGWTDLFWRNGKDNFPIATIGTNVADYNFKFDIYVRSTIAAGNLKFRMGDYYWNYGPAAPPAQGQVDEIPSTDGWVTVTVSLTDFRDNFGWGNSITDLNAVGDGQFGLAWDNGTADVDILIDNVRFEVK